jgi:RNA polymerase sigma-70 factor (ECF subfamily)
MTSYDDKSDTELVEFIVNGNHAAFSQLVVRHTDKFFALAYRTLQNQAAAEDVVQMAFIKFWQRPQMWAVEKSKFTTWFYRVIINACHDHQRRFVREMSAEPADFESALPSSPSVERQIDAEQSRCWRQSCLESGIRKLPNSQRDALNLIVYSELPQKQAAEILGISLKALESLLVRAKKNLRKHIESLERKMRENDRLTLQTLTEKM